MSDLKASMLRSLRTAEQCQCFAGSIAESCAVHDEPRDIVEASESGRRQAVALNAPDLVADLERSLAATTEGEHS